MNDRYWMIREYKKGPQVEAAGYYRHKWQAKKMRNQLRERLPACVVSFGPDNRGYIDHG